MVIHADPPTVAVITRERDFHAHAVQWALREHGAECRIIESDRLAVDGGMSWADPGGARGVVADRDGRPVDLAEVDVLWWRRLTGAAQIPEWLDDPAARDLVERECRATLVGMTLATFRGTWVSHPEATRLAENKLVQLQAAASSGLRLPRTLVSQDPAVVRKFCEDLDFRVVVKTVAGTPRTPVMAGRVTPEILRDSDIALCPAIYQEYVPGCRHLRVCCFGDRVITAMLETDALDWRYPLDAEVTPFELDEETASRVRALVGRLGLRMGIGDMKIDPVGNAYWLEVNPQGQFLFLEGMCELPLTVPFTEFLLGERRKRSAA